MHSFGSSSTRRLGECHPDLIKLFTEIIKHVDCSVLCGHRGKEDQDEAVATGKSHAPWPKGRHNQFPSNAIDVAPYDPRIKGGIPWEDRERLTLFAGFVLGIAEKMDINIRWGGDWNKDFKVADNKFDDFPHFELRL